MGPLAGVWNDALQRPVKISQVFTTPFESVEIAIPSVIVMTFWYVVTGTDLNFFELFYFIIHLGLITTPMFSLFT